MGGTAEMIRPLHDIMQGIFLCAGSRREINCFAARAASRGRNLLYSILKEDTTCEIKMRNRNSIVPDRTRIDI